MNILNNQQKFHTTRQKPVPKLALTDLNHPSFHLVQSTPVKRNIVPVEADVIISEDELVIETEPEVVLVLGYAEFGDNLEIYGNL
jgi:hypothetical protein